MRKTTRLVPLVIALAIGTAGLRAQPARSAIPSDFRVTIHDYPGLSELKPFETTVTAGGHVEQTVYVQGQNRKKRYTISPASVARLFAAIQMAHFFSLAKEYPTDAEDCATLVMTVHAKGRTHRVTFATCFRKPGTEAEAKRFLSVWAAALRAVPSPNPEQKPELYSR